MKGPGWDWDDVYPAARPAATVNGRVRAAPALIDDLAVVYNKKLFRAGRRARAASRAGRGTTSARPPSG